MHTRVSGHLSWGMVGSRNCRPSPRVYDPRRGVRTECRLPMDDRKPAAELAALTRELEEMRNELVSERTRFADFASIASDWWWEMSADLRLTYVSDRFAKLFNRNVAEVLGKPRRDMA